MRLFIAEKPSMARSIVAGMDGKETKGDGFYRVGNDVVTYLFGHVLEQFEPEDYDEKYKKWNLDDLPIVPTEWKTKVKPSASKQYKIVSKLCKEADEIVNAGDPDREGQLLVDEVLDKLGVLRKKKISRILLNALDVKSVRAALADLRDNNDFVPLRNSALARQRADWLIGMNLSRIYTILARKAGYDMPGVSVGRVKTPTVGLVVRRDVEIKKFHPVDFFTPIISYHHDNGDFLVKWKHDDRDGVDAEGRILKKEIADAIIEAAKSPATVTELTQEKKQTKQRLPYCLSTLQVEAGKKYGLSPQEVLDTQQSLYEKKLTTYPRSDCEHLDQGTQTSLLRLPQLPELPQKDPLSLEQSR